MKEIQNSSLPGTRATFGYIREVLQPEFTLANWDYEHGYFDCTLDEQEGMVYLRLPVKVLQGELDSPDAWLEMGTPFVLKHVYQTGVEEDTGYYEPIVSAMMNQFQQPVDKDAEIEEKWMRQAEQKVKQLERIFE
jgi:YugN-like family